VTLDPILERALGYPYERPSGPFRWRDGRVEFWTGPLPPGGTVVIAYGSNVAPEQLRRKFGGEVGIDIVTVRASLIDHDVVYAPFFAHYGSLPATLSPSPGTRVEVWLQRLEDRALEIMHETEGVPEVYRFTRGFVVDLEDGTRPEAGAICAYVMTRGALLVDGEAVRLAEVSAAGARFPARSQVEMQEWARGYLGVPGSVGEFVQGNVGDAGARRERSGRLPSGG
jgi:hypothetical protein